MKKPKKPIALPAPCLDADGNLVLFLPVPDRAISPNARRGESRWAAIRKSKIVKAHRTLAFARALDGFVTCFRGVVPPAAGYKLAHYFPTAAERDDDNADAACKAYRDGIAGALGIDDKKLRKLALSTIGKDAKCPRVEVTVILRENETSPYTGATE